jgi:signal transduction histidine kinase
MRRICKILCYTILKNAHHLLGLVNDVLDLQKIGAGRMQVPSSRVEVRELLTSVVDETRSLASKRNMFYLVMPFYRRGTLNGLLKPRTTPLPLVPNEPITGQRAYALAEDIRL